MEQFNNVDIIVIGAGVAGGVFACSQQDSNRKILVIERDLSEQERIVGELLQPGGIVALKQLQLESLLEGYGAQEVVGYTLVNGATHFSIPYPLIDNQSSGLGLKNGKLLLKIQERLSKQENVTLVEGNVLELIEENNRIVGVVFQDKLTNEKITVKASLTVISDGPLSRLRDTVALSTKKVSSFFIGMVLKNIDPIKDKTGHVIIGGKSPVLVYPINESHWRILVDYPGGKAPAMGEKMQRYLKEEIYDLLPEGMKDAFLAALAENDIHVMPNHYLKARAKLKEGAVLLGDSLNMRHPLTGGGMTACFLDIILLKEVLSHVDLKNEKACNQAILDYYNQRSKQVETINILADALYQVVKDEDLKQAVFSYLKQGGEKASVPLSLIAGLNKNKQTLLKHFFKITLQKPTDFVLHPRKQYRTLNKAFKIIFPLLKEENKRATIE